jgi:hypothetical protein
MPKQARFLVLTPLFLLPLASPPPTPPPPTTRIPGLADPAADPPAIVAQPVAQRLTFLLLLANTPPPHNPPHRFPGLPDPAAGGEPAPRVDLCGRQWTGRAGKWTVLCPGLFLSGGGVEGETTLLINSGACQEPRVNQAVGPMEPVSGLLCVWGYLGGLPRGEGGGSGLAEPVSGRLCVRGCFCPGGVEGRPCCSRIKGPVKYMITCPTCGRGEFVAGSGLAEAVSLTPGGQASSWVMCAGGRVFGAGGTSTLEGVRRQQLEGQQLGKRVGVCGPLQICARQLTGAKFCQAHRR